MSAPLIDLVRSLTALMDEESRLLADGRRGDLAELAGAKLRLTTALEKGISARARTTADWQEALPAAERDELRSALDALQQAAADNRERLLRQIELSRDLMEAIVGEVRRLEGHGANTYGAAGGLQRFELPSPVSVNARL